MSTPDWDAMALNCALNLSTGPCLCLTVLVLSQIFQVLISDAGSKPYLELSMLASYILLLGVVDTRMPMASASSPVAPMFLS